MYYEGVIMFKVGSRVRLTPDRANHSYDTRTLYGDTNNISLVYIVNNVREELLQLRTNTRGAWWVKIGEVRAASVIYLGGE